MEQIHGHASIRAANKIVGDFVALRDHVRVSAEGFAVLDFAQGRVAMDLPTDTAKDIIHVLRGDFSRTEGAYLNDLVMYWLETYRRAYSNIIMRVFEDGADPMAA